MTAEQLQELTEEREDAWYDRSYWHPLDLVAEGSRRGASHNGVQL